MLELLLFEAVKVYTLVEFYNYIKAVEYLICVGYFATFPLFYKFVIKTPAEREASKAIMLETCDCTLCVNTTEDATQTDPDGEQVNGSGSGQ